MPVHLKQLSREAYCSAPLIPSSSSSLRPPRLTREAELRRPRAPLQTDYYVKREISSIESVEDAPDGEWKVEEFKPQISFEEKPQIPFDPRQRDDPLQALFIVVIH